MKKLTLILALFAAAAPMHAGILQRGKVQLICHRTSNRDMPENTLEALALAARMGCNIVEVDIRMTLDGQLVLNHDGMLERLTEGMGDVESTSFDELSLLDTGVTMGERFANIRIPRFTDALRVAREQGIGLDLDIKEKGEGAAIYAALREEGMTERVIFGGEDGAADDLRALMPSGNADPAEWLGPECTAAQVAAAHAQGKFVVANFSANSHEMDLPAMRAAVAAGVDAINVDYPRLGADAVGRPVEAKLAALASAASAGTVEKRTAAIRELSRYTGFPTQQLFARWLRDPDTRISRAAAVALVVARPATSAQVFLDALSSNEPSTRTNAAWALGITHVPAAAALLPLLQDKDPVELKEALLALSRCLGDVPASAILPFFQHEVPMVRAAAALALTKHQPELAVQKVPELLQHEEQRSASKYSAWIQRGRPRLTQAEIDPIVDDYREHMKLIHALEQLPSSAALPLLAKEAFRSTDDYSHVTSLTAGYQLWDRIAADPALAIHALDSPDIEVANRAGWLLVKAGPSVLPTVRAAIRTATPVARTRLIHVLAWQGDSASLPLLHELQQSSPQDRDLLDWAVQKIETLEFKQ
jgi:glycerophosphoryl diester phosphodiesterase/HEAT repeat protein